MFPALIKHQMVRPSAFHLTRVAKASVSGKTMPKATGSEEFFVAATFPDDFESSSLKNDLFQDQSRNTKNQTTPEQPSAADIEAHKADIYESILPKEPTGFVKRKVAQKRQDAQDLPEQEPGMDEL